MDQVGALYLGIDGGGTGCRAALWRNGLLGQGTAGPANLTSDFESGLSNVQQAIAAAAQAAGISEAALEQSIGHAGLAGVQSEAMARKVADSLPGRCRVTEDRDIAIAGALGPDGDGAVLAIGTGSFVGLRRGGTIRAVGGWGLQLSDQASGGWLGRAALAATLEVYDGMRDGTALSKALLERTGGTPQDIVGFSATARPADYGELAPMVVQAAAAGDALARELLEQGGDWLDRALGALGHRLEEPICLTGGLGPQYRTFLDRPGRLFVAPLGSPLDGALILARAAGAQA